MSVLNVVKNGCNGLDKDSMKLTTKYIGKTIVEVTIATPECSLMVDVCDLNGLADPEFISSLKEVADELELHNEQLKVKVK